MPSPPQPKTANADRRILIWGASALGFSLGGFFDGILLHQILQWHHLLSGLEGSGDIRMQVIADGVFHALMYVVAAVGLFLVWRGRAALGLPTAGRTVASTGLIGFGVWHVVDTLLSHWITGIHRIRQDSEIPLFWDLVWLVAFGIVPLAIGWLLKPRGGPGRPHGGKVAATLLVLAVLGAAPLAAIPPRDVSGAVVVFSPGLEPAQMMAAVQSVAGRVVWSDQSGTIWAIDLDNPGDARGLYGRGALLVSNSLIPAGCLDWIRAGPRATDTPAPART